MEKAPINIMEYVTYELVTLRCAKICYVKIYVYSSMFDRSPKIQDPVCLRPIPGLEFWTQDVE